MGLCTRRVGRGPDLVLLHGWALNSAVWEPVVEELAEWFQVSLIDLPGHGHTGLSHEFSIEKVADAIANEIPAGAAVLGWSLGGMIAIVLAARHPSSLHRLILVATNPCFVATEQRPSGFPTEQLALFAKGLAHDYEGTIRQFLGASTLGAAQGPALLRHLTAIMQDSPRPDEQALRGGLDILHHADLWETLPEIRCPTLAILGERDTLVPAAIGTPMTDALPQGELLVIKGAGHAPFLSHTRQFVDAVREFAA